MNKQALLNLSYILHRRSYRETSFLVELFTQSHGRLTVVAKGVRKQRSATQGLLQPFMPVLVSWSGKGELMTLTHIEPHGEAIRLRGEGLFAGLYLNELLIYLLQKWDTHPRLYSVYEKTLIALQTGTLEPTLRSFEMFLLEEMGYGLLPNSDISLHNTFAADKYYRFIPEHGFVVSDPGETAAPRNASVSGNLFSGKNLIAIAKKHWQDEEALQDAKRLIRFVMAPLLGGRPIYSRRLFRLPEEKK